MAVLTPGANQALPTVATVTLAVTTAAASVDLVALCVDAEGRADGDNGVALWTQPQCAGGAVTIDVRAGAVTVALAALPAESRAC